MWGYEYEDQKRKKRKKNLTALIVGLVAVGFLAWVGSIFQVFSPNERMLFSAAEDGDPKKVYEALAHGANPNTKNWKGRTPLHVAAWHGEAGVARALIMEGADPNVRDDSAGETPLHTAVRANQSNMVIVLMSGGARSTLATYDETEPDVRGNVHPAGSTALQIAERAGFEKIEHIFRGG